ncbi:hypothetical protein AB1K70_19155 [Bremerella sp. JC770]|uniref:hypothetical protein n=1 Tax=Bremerella sp. JC770 TaxID=3232137 RepID=UPI003457A0C8
MPIGFILERDGKPYYCSAEATVLGGEAPDADFFDFASNKPDLAAGIVMFDSWICNEDRSEKNAIYDPFDQEMFLIDHGRALLGVDGLETLLAMDKKIALHPDFAKHISDASAFGDWYNRLMQIPEYMITDATKQGEQLGISPTDYSAVAKFLIERRAKLPLLLDRNKNSLFPNLKACLWSPFGGAL